MNDRFLFRAKRDDNGGEWVTGIIQPPGYNDNIMQTTWAIGKSFNDCALGRVSIRVDPKTVGQFTGLLDKHGQKIFDGDVVKYKWENKKGVDEIVFEYAVFRLKNNMPLNCFDDIKVIGNVFDNPELLKTE